MSQISHIDFRIPCATKKQIQDWKILHKILAQAGHFKSQANGDLESIFKINLSPKTIFKRYKELKIPSVSFVTDDGFDNFWSADNLAFGFNLPTIPTKLKAIRSEDYPNPSTKPISAKDFFYKMTSKVKEVNHTGINFSPNHLQEKEYNFFKQNVAQRSNLYRYPTGEEWPFMIPSNLQEFESDIKDESLNRNPKFEIVYSDYNKQPLIQIDLATTLTKNEVYELFPDPYGISFDGLEDSFRSIFIDVDWGNVLLRFDLGFRGNGQDFGYWMIKEGGRIKG